MEGKHSQFTPMSQKAWSPHRCGPCFSSCCPHSLLFLPEAKNTVCVCVCVCVFCPVHSSIKLGDDESRIIPPTVKVRGPHSLGQGWVGAWTIDASSPCADRAPIIANACDVLREGKIYSKGLFSLHWIDYNLQCWPCFWLQRAKLCKKYVSLLC